jgi:23S rRNA (guanosine2251-2'-O)-methyltransferase
MDAHHNRTEAKEECTLEGLIAVEAVLFSDAREVFSVIADEGMDHRKLEPIRRLAKKRGVEIEKLARPQLDERVGHEKHGGVVAEVGPRAFVSLDDLLRYSGGERSLVVMLDGVEDPFNFGQAVRSLYAAGCHGVVVRPRNWAMADGEAPAIIARASAGTTELMPMAVAETPDEAAAFFKDKGLTVVATADGSWVASGGGVVALFDADLTRPTLLLIGGEKRGLKRSVLDLADTVVRIPYARSFDYALGTVAATSVLGFEIARQRRG